MSASVRVLTLAGILLTATTALGQRGAPDATGEARRLYQRATQLVDAAQWYEALGLFERSYQLRPHAVTLFNIAVCERALGRYTRARAVYERLLAASGDAAPPEALVAEIRVHARELDGLLAHLRVRLEPLDAVIVVDGRPLEPRGADQDGPIFWAGLHDPGAAAAASASHFELVADPGAHVISVTRSGYSPAVVRASWPPGAHAELPLELARLAGHLQISSDRERAVISVDGIDVGAAPLSIERPPGRYRVLVQKIGFMPYRASIALAPGQETSLHAQLVPFHAPIWKKWWFWTSAGAIVTSVALGGYLGARATETPQLDGGGLQWVAKVR